MGNGTNVLIEIVESFESFEDEMLRILCVAAVVSLALGIATEGL